LFKEFGFTAKTVVAAAQSSLDAATGTTAPTHPAASGPVGPADEEVHPGVTIN
jgi:transketolase